MILKLCVLAIGCLSLFSISVLSDEIIFDRVEIINASFVEGLYNISLFEITKYNRTTYVFNSKMDLLVDSDQDTKIRVNFYYNRMNNNQYSKTLMRIPNTPCCTSIQRASATLNIDSMDKYTNFPFSSGCPLKKVYDTQII